MAASMLGIVLRSSKHGLNDIVRISQRSLWGYLNSVFNKVDRDRVKEFGPDRACAEWMLRCGGAIKWKGFKHLEKDYNALPTVNRDLYKVEEIDASGAAVMSLGFPHLDGLLHVKRIKLHNCKYLYDPALTHLPLIKETLEHLQISENGSFTDDSLKPLAELKNLKTLLLYNLPEVRNIENVKTMLQSCLKSCDIQIIEPGQNDS